MQQSKLINHKLLNWFHTTLLIAGMLFLLALLGVSIGGGTGLLWAVLAGVFLLLFAPRVSPNFILRMNRARPLHPQEAPQLYAMVQELARRAMLPASPRLYYVPSQMTNAFTLGSGDRAVIGVTDGILRRLNSQELAGVLAHEISHIRHNDMRVMGLADMIGRVTRLFSNVGQVLLLLNFPLLLFGQLSISWFAIFLLIFAPALSGLLMMALSRAREFDADLSAALLTGDPLGLASALEKIETYQASFFRRVFFPRYRAPEPSLFRTHPPTNERIRRLLEISNITRQGGTKRPNFVSSGYGVFNP